MSKKTWSTILVVVLFVAAAVGIYYLTRPPIEEPVTATTEPIAEQNPALTDTPKDAATQVPIQSPASETSLNVTDVTPDASLEIATPSPTQASSVQSEDIDTMAAPLNTVITAANEKISDLSVTISQAYEEAEQAAAEGIAQLEHNAAADALNSTVAQADEKIDTIIEIAQEKFAIAEQASDNKIDAAAENAQNALSELTSEIKAVKASIWHSFTKDQEAYLQKSVKDFNASQEKYEIILLSQPTVDFTENLKSAVIGGVGPDIIFNYPSEAVSYEKSGLVADLSQFIYDETIGIKDFEGSLEDYLMNGEVMAFDDGLIHYLPAYTTGPIFFYNKTIFDELNLEVPTTWNEMEQAAKTIYDAKGMPALGFRNVTDVVQMLIMETPEAGYIDVKNKQVLFDTPQVREKIKWLVDMVKQGYFLVKPTAGYFADDFNSGVVVAGFIDSTASLPYIHPADNKFEFAMAPVPAESWYPSWNRGPIVFYYKDDARAQAAYEFVKYFISADVNAGWVESVVALSPYQWTQENENYKAFINRDTLESKALQAVQHNLSKAGSLPSVIGASEVRAAIKAAVEKAALGDLSVDEAWDEAVKISNAALKDE